MLATPIEDIIINENALSQLPDILLKHCKNKSNAFSVMIVADSNTYNAAGKRVKALLDEKCIGVAVNEYIFHTYEDAELIPNETSVGKLLIALEPRPDIIVAVGSGTINDLCRFVGYRCGIPYIIAATAPSVDGYASGVAPLIVNTLKTTYAASCPVAIIGDLDILSNAPSEMLTAGIGDVLGKYSALCDWKLSSIVNNEHYSNEIAQITAEALQKTVDSIGSGSVKPVMNALVLSGIAMSQAGSSRPASGCEHHIAHFLEMAFLFEGRKPALHGIMVGLSELYVAMLYEKLVTDYGNKPVDWERALESANAFNQADWEQKMQEVFGAASDQVIADERKTGRNSTQARIKRIESCRSNWQDIIAVIKSEMPPSNVIIDLYKSAGGSVFPSDLGVSQELFYSAILHAKEIRERYTLLQMLSDLGILEEYASYVRQQLIPRCDNIYQSL